MRNRGATLSELRAHWEWGGQVRMDPADFDDAIEKVRAEAKQEALESVRSLIQDLTTNDDDPCQFDHRGGCQAHGYLTLEPGEMCPQEEAKRWLRARADKLVTE